MHGPGGYHPQQHIRFYIVMITLVIGGIFFLLIMNNNNNTSFTGALISDGENLILGNSDSQDTEKSNNSESETNLQKALSKEVGLSNHELDFVLNARTIPDVYTNTKVENIKLHFTDLKTIISVNGDELELNDLDEVDLRIIGFQGTLDFNKADFSLDGFAKRIEVNNVALSSKGEIELSFEGLKYDSFSINKIKLEQLVVPNTDGFLKVGKKFQYTLDNDEVKLYTYEGSFDVADNETTTLEGSIKGISVSGTELNVNVN